MAIDLSGYYGSIGDISKNIEEGMSGLGIAAGHGIDKIRKRKSQARAEGKAPGILGWGLGSKLFGQSARDFKAPISQSEYEEQNPSFGFTTGQTSALEQLKAQKENLDPADYDEKYKEIMASGPKGYEDYLTSEHGGTWETRDGMGYRKEGAKKGALGTYGLTGGKINPYQTPRDELTGGGHEGKGILDYVGDFGGKVGSAIKGAPDAFQGAASQFKEDVGEVGSQFKEDVGKAGGILGKALRAPGERIKDIANQLEQRKLAVSGYRDANKGQRTTREDQKIRDEIERANLNQVASQSAEEQESFDAANTQLLKDLQGGERKDLLAKLKTQMDEGTQDWTSDEDSSFEADIGIEDKKREARQLGRENIKSAIGRGVGKAKSLMDYATGASKEHTMPQRNALKISEKANPNSPDYVKNIGFELSKQSKPNALKSIGFLMNQGKLTNEHLQELQNTVGPEVMQFWDYSGESTQAESDAAMEQERIQNIPETLEAPRF